MGSYATVAAKAGKNWATMPREERHRFALMHFASRGKYGGIQAREDISGTGGQGAPTMPVGQLAQYNEELRKRRLSKKTGGRTVLGGGTSEESRNTLG